MDIITRVVQRFVMASFHHAVDLEAPPSPAEQRDTKKILTKLSVGVGHALKSLDKTQAAERQALQSLQKAIGKYNDKQVPTLRVEQEIQFHALLATKHLGSLDPKALKKDAVELSSLVATTG